MKKKRRESPLVVVDRQIDRWLQGKEGASDARKLSLFGGEREKERTCVRK